MIRRLAVVALTLALTTPVAARTKRAPVGQATAPRVAATPAAAPEPANLRAKQYLFGSGEAAALSRQTWRVLADYVDGQLADGVARSVVLAPGSTLGSLSFLPCGARPPAIVLDVDETALLNLGAEYDDLIAQRPRFDEAVWDRWEKTGAAFVAPTPGAKEALDRLRDHGVTVIFNSNRASANAAGAEAAINAVGLGPAKHGETLFLRGDDASGSRKDGRRQLIAGKYCVLAMAGDQLGDFSDLFNSEPAGVAARRATVAYSGVADMWGNGWFVLPNPSYGTALKGGPDDIFPRDKQWRDPGAAPVPAPTSQKAK